MSRRTKIGYITDNYTRKTTFRKRKECLFRKVNEVSTLCGVEACAVIYSPNEPQPEVWPNNLDARRILTEFKQMPKSLQIKKMSDHESLMKKKISKISEQLKGIEKENRQMKTIEMAYKCWNGTRGLEDLTMEELDAVEGVLDEKAKEIGMKTASFRISKPSSSSLQCLQLF